MDPARRLVFVADTANHRLLAADMDTGALVKTWGAPDGRPGFSDGGVGGNVLFDSPRGMCIDRITDLLWIADSGNDCLRRLSLKDMKNIVAVKALKDESEPSKIISGDISEDFERTFKEKYPDETKRDNAMYGLSRTFRTPVGVTKVDSLIYVTAASSNQIWRIDDGGFRLLPAVGSGKRGIQDFSDPPLIADRSLNSLLTDNVRLAQPMGITGYAGKVYFTEGDSSTLRQLTLRDSACTTLLGGDKLFANNLLLFGDKDGVGRGAKLQYPTSLCAIGGPRFLLCDTLNHKIKLVTITETGSGPSAKSKTLAGTGKRGSNDGYCTSAQFNEPSAVAYDVESDQAWICDSMNNAIRVIDLKTSTVKTFEIKGL